MTVFISIDGVLRNTLKKIEYHYNDYYLETDSEEEAGFLYRINEPITNRNILDHFIFQSKEEYEEFLFIEYPLEIFGHATTSYQHVFTELNKLMYDNKDINFVVIGMDEIGKSKPASLFFLSKNGFLGNSIQFISSENIKGAWEKCDVWITDNKKIIDMCPKNKLAVKFNTEYNEYFKNEIEINKLTEKNEIWLKFLAKTTTSILTKLMNGVKQVKQLRTPMEMKHLK